jgi:hypothetical protein
LAWVAGTGRRFVALLIGIVGYHGFEAMPWIDAMLNASMILGGMGPVDSLHTTSGKLFASAYALFSGALFIGVMGIIWLHLHTACYIASISKMRIVS